MYRIRTSRYPDGNAYLRVELPMMSEPQLDILETVVSAIWRVLDPQAGPTLVWLPRQSGAKAQPTPKTKSPRAATPGLDNPSHLSTVKGENDEHGS